MKRRMVIICLIIIVVAILGTIIFIKNSESNYAKNFNFSENEILAVFYIGGTKDSYDYSVAKKYFNENELSSFEDIKIGGEEKYLIIPRYKGNVEIYSLSLDNEDIKSKLIKNISQPFYITCNESDIFPNSRIRVCTRTGEYVYTPYISLKDGSIVGTENTLVINK